MPSIVWIIALFAFVVIILLVPALIALSHRTKESQLRKNEKPRNLKKLSHEERDQMLQSVQNLARENPQQMAGMIRKWIREPE